MNTIDRNNNHYNRRIARVMLLGLLSLFLTSCGDLKRKDPQTITYREFVTETDSVEVWRTVEYKIAGMTMDTIPKTSTCQLSTIETPRPDYRDRAKTAQTDKPNIFKVDLNDYLSVPDDPTNVDWNHTEIDSEIEEWLYDVHGVYWDSDVEAWVKKTNK